LPEVLKIICETLRSEVIQPRARKKRTMSYNLFAAFLLFRVSPLRPSILGLSGVPLANVRAKKEREDHAICRSRQALSNEYLIAAIGVDAATQPFEFPHSFQFLVRRLFFSLFSYRLFSLAHFSSSAFLVALFVLIIFSTCLIVSVVAPRPCPSFPLFTSHIPVGGHFRYLHF